jgi:peptide/nickel transport system ATP-binding protein/oligopeptide transport system ATP-binding protein
MSSEATLDIQGLTTQFQTRRGLVTAVDNVDLTVGRQETVCVVGESGCGKSVMSLSVLRLVPAPHGRISHGKIFFQGRDLLTLNQKEIIKIRGDRIAMIFQEPMSSLNPVFTVGFQIEEVLRKHRRMNKKEAREMAVHMLDRVGIPEPEVRSRNYPHQMSGGMMQRVMIAMALSCEPELLIADEPTTALDVTIQAQILDLLNKLQEETGASILLITHDLGVVAEMARHVMVMYAGKAVERAAAGELFGKPLHPYTVGLFDSLPKIGRSRERLKPIPGNVPSLINLPPGCPLQDRCIKAEDDCRGLEPPWTEHSGGHWVRCWHPME